MKNITIDKSKCIGCGMCTMLASKTFKLGKDGKSEVIKPWKDNDDQIKEAESSCPVNAIKTEK
jgi:ferredoxin